MAIFVLLAGGGKVRNRGPFLARPPLGDSLRAGREYPYGSLSRVSFFGRPRQCRPRISSVDSPVFSKIPWESARFDLQGQFVPANQGLVDPAGRKMSRGSGEPMPSPVPEPPLTAGDGLEEPRGGIQTAEDSRGEFEAKPRSGIRPESGFVGGPWPRIRRVSVGEGRC